MRSLILVLVAQVSNLLYRGFPIRIGHHARMGSRLEVGDTAGLETCATIDHEFESHPLLKVALTQRAQSLYLAPFV